MSDEPKNDGDPYQTSALPAPRGPSGDAANGSSGTAPDPYQTSGAPAPRSPVTLSPMIGPYKLLQQLGEGGMGVVWMAEQREPVHRNVAIKIIKGDMRGSQVVARFEAERQALAMMDHPNIAKVLDAGMYSPTPSMPGAAAEGGQPYFVMELVKGIPFGKYCDQEKLTLKERLELFIPVCNAVQHAHQKGVIHRDIKPSNVLVALYDGKPVPKVIDFGVAKATHQKLTDKTMFTEVGQIVGTLEYMAPEQADANNLDIDTRADIYSLGVMLYEVLTGAPPFSSKQLWSGGYEEMRRMIREMDPPKPSTKLSSADNLHAVAAQRNMEARKLPGLLQGDLDWIVMKCLEKERTHRYESASQLGEELKRYLADEPVQAGPPAAWYRIKKMLRRHQASATAAGLVLLALIVGIIGTSIGLVRAELAASRERIAKQEAIDASRKTDEALDQLLNVASKVLDNIPQMEGEQTTALANVLKEREQRLKATPESPEEQFKLADTSYLVGKIWMKLSQADSLVNTNEATYAKQSLEKAIGLLEDLKTKYPAKGKYRFALALSCNDLAEDIRTGGMKSAEERTQAKKYYDEALRLQEELRGSKDQDVADNDLKQELARTCNNRGIYYEMCAEPEKAHKEYEKAIALDEALVRNADSKSKPAYMADLGRAYTNMGVLCFRKPEFGSAKEFYGKAIQQFTGLRTLSPRRNYEFREAVARSNLGAALAPGESAPAADVALALQENAIAVDLLGRLVNDFPRYHLYRFQLAEADFSRGALLSIVRRKKLDVPKGTDESPKKLFEEASKHYAEAANACPENVKYQSDAAVAFRYLAGWPGAKEDYTKMHARLADQFEKRAAALKQK